MIQTESLTDVVFSWSKALSLAIASQVAYRDEDRVHRIARSLWGFDSSVFLDERDCQGFVCWNDSSVLVAFRGTESVGDWLSNFKVNSTDWLSGGVHSGFLENYFAVKSALLEALQEANAAAKTLHFTGHSLGGAIATIATAELDQEFPLTRLYTFGQPKTFNAGAAGYVSHLLENRYFRFVNGPDLVTRIPPGYEHAGHLIRFDHNGQVRTEPAPESPSERESRYPLMSNRDLSNEEFDELQKQLQQFQESISSLEGDRQSTLETSIEGIIPGFREHSIDEYIAHIRRQSQSRAQLEGLLKQTLQRRGLYKGSVSFAEGPDQDVLSAETTIVNVAQHEYAGNEGSIGRGPMGDDYIPVLLRVKDPDWIAPAGLKIQSRLGTVLSASVSAEELDVLRDADGITSIVTSRDGGSFDLATSKAFINADDVHRPPIGELGDSALVGIIDTGADILHRAFIDAANQTDIEYIWNQRDPTGPAPADVLAGVFDASYGTLYIRSELQEMIEGTRATPDALRDPYGHGTHVASIAAGRGAGLFAGGVAPESKLVLVIPAMRFDPADPPSLGYSTSHVDALGFLRSAAKHIDKPIVVNVSLGMNAGAHDGTSHLEAAFDGFCGNGRTDGLVIVKSAGNERGHGGHAMVDVAEGSVIDIEWESNDNHRDEDYIEFWFHSFDEIEFTLIDPNGRSTSIPVSKTNPVLSELLGGNACHLELTSNHPDNADNLLTVRIQRDQSRIQAGRWIMQMVGTQIRDSGVVHAWVERDGARAVTFLTGDNDEMTLSIPGTAEHVISVAACESQEPVRLTDSSSWGLTRDARPKPEIAAPGKAITAALANSNDHEATVALTGTSMAAPHVAGSVALVLSHLQKDHGKSMANANQIRSKLIQSAKNFNGVHHRGVGYGALDTLAFYEEF